MRLYAVDLYIGDTVEIKKREATITSVDGQNIVVQYSDDKSYDAHNPKYIIVKGVKS